MIKCVVMHEKPQNVPLSTHQPSSIDDKYVLAAFPAFGFIFKRVLFISLNVQIWSLGRNVTFVFTNQSLTGSTISV